MSYLIKTANWVRDLCGLLPTCKTRFPDRRHSGWREQDGVIGAKARGGFIVSAGFGVRSYDSGEFEEESNGSP